MKLILLLSLQMLIFYACEYPSGTRDDQIPPSIVITSPQNDTTVAGIVEIKCEVHDNMGIKRIGLIVDGSQTDEYKHRSPCVFNWNTMNYEKNSYHTIYALAVDLNDNSTISDSIRLKVDNSNLHIVYPSSIESIVYDCDEMTITCRMSHDPNFAYYELFHSKSCEHGNKDFITRQDIVSDTIFTLTEFTLAEENWFWIKVTDVLGYSSQFSMGYRVIDPLPIVSDLSFIKYIDNKFHVSWSKNTDEDFKEYQLFRSYSKDFSDKKLVYSSTNKDDTLYTIENIVINELRFYQVIVFACWNQFNVSDSRSASSYPLIVFQSSYTGDSDIYITDFHGYDACQITHSITNEFNPIFTPNGMSILYQDEDNLCTMDRYGGNKQPLTTSSGENCCANISPDGSKIVFCSNRDGNWEIYLMNIDGTGQLRLTNNDSFDGSPVFMPEGNQVAYVSEITVTVEIYSMNIDGTNKTQITSDKQTKEQLQLSPDGSSIIYVVSDMPAEEDIYSIEIGTKIIQNLTGNGMSNYAPIFSPDGSEIYYQSLTNVWNIWRMNPNGENKINLTKSQLNAVAPDVLYNGAMIVFNSFNQGKSHVFKMDKNGNNITRITSEDYSASFPKFQKRNKF